jgi:hypothetical protein
MPTQIFTASTTWTPPSDVYRVAEAFILGGGGGGGGGSTNHGAGGGGGRIRRQRDVIVTGGVSVPVVVGAGGTGGPVGTAGGAGGTSSFAGWTALGGGGGATGGGAGGASGRIDNVVSPAISVTYTGGAAGGGAGASGNSSSKNGTNGFFYTYINASGLSTTNYFGAGGGGGISTFTVASARPLLPGIGGIEGGGRGGSEDGPVIAGVEHPSSSGSPNRGAGGGGGASQGVTTVRTQLTGALTWSTTTTNAPATPGASGGSGIVIIKYEPAQFRLRTSSPGVAEGGVITLILETNEVATGSVIPFTISGPGITPSDFSSGLNAGTLNGSFTVTSSSFGEKGETFLNLTIAADALNDLSSVETATVSLNNGFASVSFYIGDFSRDPNSISAAKIIETADYNNIRNKVVSVLGASSSPADFGWGQAVVSNPVSANNFVSVNEWAALRFDIINAWSKIFDETPPLVVPSVGQAVRANLSTAPYAQYETYANAISASRGRLAPTRAITRNKDQIDYLEPWSTRIFSNVTVTFSTAQAARHFFNSGGEIRFLSEMTLAATSNQKTQSWINHLTAVGTQSFGGNKPDTLTDPNTGSNYYRLTSSFLPWYTSTTSGAYSGNIYKISARSVGVADNSTGTATTIAFLVEWIDSSVPISSTDGSTNTADVILGSTILSITTLEPTGVLQPPGTGNFVVESPTVTIVSIGP